MPTYTVIGEVSGGRLVLDRGAINRAVSHMRNGPVRLTVSTVQDTRSLRQDKFWWGVVVALFAEHCGYDRMEMHEVLKMELLPVVKLLHDPATGEVAREVIVAGSTASLSAGAFCDLVARAQRLGAEMGLYIPDPNEHAHLEAV